MCGRSGAGVCNGGQRLNKRAEKRCGQAGLRGRGVKWRGVQSE